MKNCGLWLFPYPEFRVYPVSFDLKKKSSFYQTTDHNHGLLNCRRKMLNSASMIVDFHNQS